MKTWRILWQNIFSHSKVLLVFLVLSSSVYAFFVIPMWLQKRYLEQVSLFLDGHASWSGLLVSLCVLYLARSFTGGFLVPFGHAKDLYYEYIVTRNVSLSHHEMNNKILLEHYESAPMYNLITRAKRALTSGALREALNTVGSLLTLAISLSAMLGSLMLIHPIFALISTISILPIFAQQLIFAEKFYQMRKWITETQRKQKQCINHLIGKKYCLETRVAGASRYFHDKWESYRQEIAETEMSLQVAKLRYGLLLNVVKSGSIMTMILLAANYISQGSLTVGDFSLVVSILSVLHASTGFFISKISSIYSQFKELADVTNYYELETNEASNTVFANNTIHLDHVSFKYPGRSELAVKEINKKFKPGEKVAILGTNGAGKTTLVNLILGLYKPTNGAVLYGGKDILKAQKSSLYRQMSAVFQDFGVYNLKISENIAFGDIEHGAEGSSEGSAENSRIYKSLALAGFNYDKYNDKANTLIGKEFKGVELSRGESQQIAIARSYYNHNASIVIIDEPTAALDPIAEEKLYKNFVEVAGDKTTFIVSHRLVSVSIADRILVMESAEIVEDGTHQELLELNGRYAHMYRQQQALYNRNQNKYEMAK